MFVFTISPLTRTLNALSKIIEKAEAHCAAHGVDPDVLARDRLFPDMLPLTRQVQLSCDFAARMAARLTGAEVPAFPDVETTLPELRQRIATALDYLAKFKEAQFDDAASRQITIKQRSGEMTMSGEVYHSIYALPQFYFHVTTTYNILRHNGVALGKADYMGV
jgi:hypothetical protein